MTILLVLVILLVLATLYKPAYGVMVYMIIRMCIPPAARFFGFSYNTISLGVLLLLSMPVLLKRIKNKSQIQRKFINILGVYVGVILILAFVSSITAVVPLSFQLASLTKYCFTEILPSIVVILLISSTDITKMTYVVWAGAVFATSYAIFTFFSLSNPLLDMFNTGEAVDSTAAVARRGALSSTAVGINDNKITSSLISMLIFTFFWGKEHVINKYLIYFILLLSLVATFFTSQRTSIMCLILFTAVYFVGGGFNLKKVLLVVLALVLLFFGASIYFEQFDELMNLLKAVAFFWSDEMQEQLGVGGSTMDLRVRQFLAVFEVTDIHILEGLGYDFNHYIEELNIYNSRTISDLAGFESIVFTSIVSSGLIGLVVLLWMYFKLMKAFLSVSIKKKRIYCYAFVGTFLMAAIMTNYSGSSYLFFVFLALNIIDAKSSYMINNDPSLVRNHFS